jgi:hypothetical protein
MLRPDGRSQPGPHILVGTATSKVGFRGEAEMGWSENSPALVEIDPKPALMAQEPAGQSIAPPPGIQ